jgi:hypothetical protein
MGVFVYSEKNTLQPLHDNVVKPLVNPHGNVMAENRASRRWHRSVRSSSSRTERQ